MNLWFIGYLVAIWVVTFLLVLFPARWIGKWLSGNNMPMLLGIIACIKITIAFIAFVSFFLIMMRFDFLPHVNTGKRGFVYVFTTILFGIPAFSALVHGFVRARRGDEGSGDFSIRRIHI